MKHTLVRRLTSLFVLLSLVLLSGIVAFAQDTDEDMPEMPEVLVEGIEALSEEFPDVADIEWMEYSDREVTVWLPATFEQFLLEDIIDDATEGVETLSPDLAPYIQLVRNNPDLVRILAFDSTKVVETAFAEGFVAVREHVVFDMTAEEYAEASMSLLPPSIEVAQDMVTLEFENYEAVQMQWLMDMTIMEIMSSVYVIKMDDYLYTITFTTLPDVIEEKQAIFDLIMQTFFIDEELMEDA